MNICILAPRFSLPESGGDLLRVNHIAKYLKAKGHRIVLVAYTEGEPRIDLCEGLYDSVYTIRRNPADSLFYSAIFLLRGKPIQCGYYWSKRYLRLLKEVVNREHPDLYVAHLILIMPFVNAVGWLMRFFANCFDKAFCCESPRIAMEGRLSFENATFKSERKHIVWHGR